MTHIRDLEIVAQVVWPTIMKRLLTLISAALVCCAQGITNNNIYPAPPAPTLPAALNTLVDPIFGTTLMRLTDANDGEQCTNSYSYWPSTNLNSTRVIAKCVHRTPEGYLVWDARFYKLDPTTFTVTNKEVAGVDSPLVRSPTGEYITVEDAIWSGTDPDILFAHTTTRLYSINVGTYAWTLLADLSTSVNSNMLFQMTKSIDDTVFAFTVKGLTGANIGFLVWDRRPNNLLLSVTGEHDEVHVDKSGQYLTVIQSGNRVYDLRTGVATDLTDGPPDYGMGHADFGMGIAVAVERWTPGITVRNLSTPHQFAWLWTPKLLSGTSDWSQSLHIALNTNDAWALISTFTASTLESSGILKDEIWLLATNGSGAKFRMAHHHSVYRSYYDAPRADTSQDGRFVTFTSNWGNSGRTDVFLLKVPENSPSLSVSQSVAPASGSGLSQIFTFTASDQSGSALIDGVSMLIAPTLNPANSCKVAYDRVANRLVLANDDPTSGGSSVLPGANTVVANGQCTLRGQNSRVSIGVTSVNIVVDLSFGASFSGAKNIYLNVTRAGVSSSWVLRGTWTVPGGGSSGPVTWFGRGFATVSPDGLMVQKTGGCDGCLDAGGISQQQIVAGDGYMEFTRGADTNFKQVGMDSPAVWAGAVRYGFAVWPTYTEIRENGAYRGETASAAGDVFRIQIITGQVKYFRNGVLLYTSSTAPAYPLSMQVRLSDLNSTFGNARILTASGGTSPTITSTSSLPIATVGVFYTLTLAATGGTPPYIWSVANGATLPVGLTLSAAGVLSGIISQTGGPFTFTLTVTDANNLSNNRVFLLQTPEPPTITRNSPLPSAIAGVFYSQTLVAAGGKQPYTWSVANGSLPLGLTLTSAGVLSGMIAAAGGPFAFTLIVTDTNNLTATKQFTLTVLASLPSADSVSPNSGSGSSQEFTFVFSDPQNPASLTGLAMLFATSVTTANVCYLVYDRNQGSISLLWDSGAGSNSKPIASAAILQNSQCQVSTTSVTTSGLSVILKASITFKGTFTGLKSIFMYASRGGLNTGWVNKGTFNSTANSTIGGIPTADSVVPASGSGRAQRFSFQVSDLGGSSYITGVAMLFASSLSTLNACSIVYDRTTNTLSLGYENPANGSTPLTVGSNNVVSNNQCSLYGVNSTVVIGATAIVVTLDLTFSATFFGAKNIYLYAGEPGVNTGYVLRGSWTVTSGSPTADSVSPASGAGNFPTFVFTVSDPSGASNISSIGALFTTGPPTVTNACNVLYNRNNATIGLYADDGTTLSTKPIGSSAALQNTQCAIGYSAPSTSGNSVNILVQVLFKTPVFNGAKSVYVQANEPSISSGWILRGSWTVQ